MNAKTVLREDLPIAMATIAVIVVGFGIGLGLTDGGTVVLVLAMLAGIVPSCWRMSTERDPWLWWLATLGYVAKLVGAGIRYWVLVGPYDGVGDAGGYHNAGRRFAELWRAGQFPLLDGSIGEGTQFVRWLTGVFYTPYTPTFLGGFFLFATLAFIGQLLFYAAFRRSVPNGRLKIYAMGIFFLPSLVFWPSSVGKESLMMLFLGVAAYGFARSFVAYQPLWLLIGAAGAGGAGLIRPHIAALLAAAFAGAAILGRGGKLSVRAAVRRVVVIVSGVALVAVSLVTVADRFELTELGDVDPFVNTLERNTQQGGSSVEGEAITSPTQLPAGFLRVLFRPLPHEAANIQGMASAIESVILLGLIALRAPVIVRRINSVRTPYVLMSAAFTFGFAIAFSALFNLGILARQRSQALPFLLAAIVAMGWKDRPMVATPSPADAEPVPA